MLTDSAVIILCHNGADFTEICLKSLLNAKSLPKELYLIDNGSADETPAVIQEHLGAFQAKGIEVKTWRNENNKGCSEARNDAWKQVSSEYTVFLDNDTAVCTSGWLELLKSHLDKEQEIAILGPKMIYPYKPHPIQCAGVAISSRGRIAFRGRGNQRHAERFAHDTEVPALISACWMMRTQLREKIGYLDELFHPVQYEDLDLCLRALERGWKIMYTPQVEMYHFEGITTASFGQEEYRRNIARNSLKFRERWHHLYQTFEDEFSPSEYRWLDRQELGLQPELDLHYCQ